MRTEEKLLEDTIGILAKKNDSRWSQNRVLQREIFILKQNSQTRAIII